MALNKYKLGTFIERHDIKNGKDGSQNVMGISVNKEFRVPTSKVDRSKLSNYKVVKPRQIAFVQTTHNEKVFAYAFNNTDEDIVVSSVNEVFSTNESKLLPEFLAMFFNRTEFDRYARYHSWGSARETFTWKDLCDIEIELPPIYIQQKYVDIYNSMIENQKTYEIGLEDLKLVCDAYIENLRKNIEPERIEAFIERYDVRNGKDGTKNVMGISVNKEFRIPTSKVDRSKLSNYKVVKPRQIAFVQTTHNEKVFAYAFNNTDEDIVVSSVNEVFSTNESKLLPEFLAMFFNRTEFDRYARYHSWGSARETFTWNDLIEVKIPIPDISVQQSIVDIYTVYKERKEINERLKLQLKEICPILIKGSLEEANL